MAAKKAKEIDPLIISELLRCDPETGKLYWNHRGQKYFSDIGSFKKWNTRYAGNECFKFKNELGYMTGKIFNVNYKAHRIIWVIENGRWPECEIDHINGIRDDNRIVNLRCVTKSENARNSKMRTTNKSGVQGVHFNKLVGKWEAYIWDDGKIILGYYSDKEIATKVRRDAEVELGYHPNHGRM